MTNELLIRGKDLQDQITILTEESEKNLEALEIMKKNGIEGTSLQIYDHCAKKSLLLRLTDGEASATIFKIAEGIFNDNQAKLVALKLEFEKL